MKPMYKILITVVIIVIVGLGIYFVWKLIITPPAPETPLEATGEPSQETEILLKKISDQPVFNFWVMPGTKNIPYFTLDGKVFNTKENKDSLLSNQVINALNNAALSPDEQKILASFGDPRQPQWGIFDLIDRIWRPLPSEIQKAAWGNSSEQLVVLVKRGNELNLAWVDLTKNPHTYKIIIKDFRFEDIDLLLKSPKELLIIERPTAFYNSRAWQLNPDDASIIPLTDPAAGLILRWSRDGKIVFKFSLSDIFLLILDQNLQETIPVSFNTLPDKCSVTTNAVYCFVPQIIPETVILPDDYFQKKFFSTDDLYSINLETGESKIIFKSGFGQSQFVDAFYPQYLDGSIYFINRYDGYLYELKL